MELYVYNMGVLATVKPRNNRPLTLGLSKPAIFGGVAANRRLTQKCQSSSAKGTSSSVSDEGLDANQSIRWLRVVAISGGRLEGQRLRPKLVKQCEVGDWPD